MTGDPAQHETSERLAVPLLTELAGPEVGRRGGMLSPLLFSSGGAGTAGQVTAAAQQVMGAAVGIVFQREQVLERT